MPPVNAGDLTCLITIQRAVRVSDGEGGWDTSYETRDTVWGQVTAANYREALQAGSVTSTLLTAVNIYYRTDISVSDRLVFEGRTLQIQSVQDPDGAKEMLRIVASEVQA